MTGLVLLMAGCKEQVTPTTSTSAVAEPAGENCRAGGVAIRSGIDADGDGTVSASEAKTTTYLCNGQNGSAGSLIAIVTEPSGTNCPAGGHKVTSGPDTNGNGTLDASEVTATEYLCGSGASSTALLRKTAIAGSTSAECPGGLVRVAFGADTNGNQMLDTDEERTSFTACNRAPFISPTNFEVANCSQAYIVPVDITDADGTVATVTAQVLASGSMLNVTVEPNKTIVVSGGMHVGGAVIEVSATDDMGANTTRTVVLSFTGTGCVPDYSFYGVQPSSCVGAEVDPLAGDDRSGPVVTAQSVYYNGDNGLVRFPLDLQQGAGVQLVAARIDTLLGDTNRLYSLWSSAWPASGTTDGGVLDTRFDLSDSTSPTLDQLVVIDETTFQPGTPIALPFNVVADPRSFTVTDPQMMPVTASTDYALVAAADGHALLALHGSCPGSYCFRYGLVNVATGAVVVDRSVIIPTSDPLVSRWRWDSQEDSNAFQHYALTHRGTEFFLTYRDLDGNWNDLELSAGTPIVRTGSFAQNCDVQNLALSANGRTAWFHSEGTCFGVSQSEVLVRCATLIVDNSSGAVDDTGNTSGGNIRKK
ncbi:MAG: DUF7151 family protein [Myxococcota bacterium]